MWTGSFDEACIAYHAADPDNHRDRLHVADATGPRVHRIRTRVGRPGDAVNHDPETGGRRAEIPPAFVLNEQDLLDLATLHLADFLQQIVASNAALTEPKVVPYLGPGGRPGFWVLPPHGYAGIRREGFGTMAKVLGGAAGRDWEAKQRACDSGAPAAEWVEDEASAEQLRGQWSQALRPRGDVALAAPVQASPRL